MARRQKAGDHVQKTALQVSGIDHVVLNVSDLERSKSFYMDVLGFGFRNVRDDFASCGIVNRKCFAGRRGDEAAVN